MDRVLCSIDEARRGIDREMVTRVEFIQGETEDEDYIILDFESGLTLYASTPSVYRDLTEDERV